MFTTSQLYRPYLSLKPAALSESLCTTERFERNLRGPWTAVRRMVPPSIGGKLEQGIWISICIHICRALVGISSLCGFYWVIFCPPAGLQLSLDSTRTKGRRQCGALTCVCSCSLIKINKPSLFISVPEAFSVVTRYWGTVFKTSARNRTVYWAQCSNTAAKKMNKRDPFLCY